MNEDEDEEGMPVRRLAARASSLARRLVLTMSATFFRATRSDSLMASRNSFAVATTGVFLPRGQGSGKHFV